MIPEGAAHRYDIVFALARRMGKEIRVGVEGDEFDLSFFPPEGPDIIIPLQRRRANYHVDGREKITHQRIFQSGFYRIIFLTHYKLQDYMPGPLHIQ